VIWATDRQDVTLLAKRRRQKAAVVKPAVGYKREMT